LEHELLDWPPVLVHTELIAIERGQLYLASELPGAAGSRQRPFRGAKAVDTAAAATLLPKLPPPLVGEEREEGGT